MRIHKFLNAYGRRLGLLMLSALALAVIAGVATVHLLQSSAATARSVVPASAAIPTPISIKVSPLPTSEVPNMPWFDDFFGEQVPSLDGALSRVEFKVLLPRVMAEGYPLIWIGVSSPDAPTDAQMVNLVYSDGKNRVRISQAVFDKDQVPVLTDALLAEWNQERVTINGHDGMGHGPQIGTTKIYGTTRSPSAIKWWSDGVVHYVQSFELSLSDLKAIAESMQ